MLENADGGTEGSLMSALDMCATVMGKRRLRAWLCRPMARIADIAERQDAVADLMGPAAHAAQAARDALSGETQPCIGCCMHTLGTLSRPLGGCCPVRGGRSECKLDFKIIQCSDEGQGYNERWAVMYITSGACVRW